jgi:outer membrane murein-binding lipoprotein Lpp
VAAALVALLLLGAVLWQTLLKPTISSAAKDAVATQMSPLSSQVADAQQKANQALQQADPASSGSGAPGLGSGGGTGTGTGATPAPTAGPVLDHPVDYRIQADAAPRTDNGFNTFTASGQSGKPLDVTDIQLQNPAGDSGVIEIRRNGTVWLRFGLDNFRDYDDHFVVPVRFAKGESVVFAVSCKNPAGKRCSPALTFSGKTTG